MYMYMCVSLQKYCDMYNILITLERLCLDRLRSTGLTSVCCRWVEKVEVCECRYTCRSEWWRLELQSSVIIFKKIHADSSLWPRAYYTYRHDVISPLILLHSCNTHLTVRTCRYIYVHVHVPWPRVCPCDGVYGSSMSASSWWANNLQVTNLRAGSDKVASPMAII